MLNREDWKKGCRTGPLACEKRLEGLDALVARVRRSASDLIVLWKPWPISGNVLLLRKRNKNGRKMATDAAVSPQGQAGITFPRMACCFAIRDSSPCRARRIIAASWFSSKTPVLGSGLQFDELIGRGHDEVHVHIGAGIFLVAEIEQRFAIHDSNAYCGDKVIQRG